VPSSGTYFNDKRMRLLLLVAGSTALLIRLLFLQETRGVPFMRHLVGDAAGYYAWAQEIAGGEWWGTEPFYQAPLYPYVLGALSGLLTDELWLLRVVQALWGAVAVWLLGYGTWKIFGCTAGLIAAGMLALYAPAIVFDGMIQKASLGCLLNCSLIACIGVFMSRPRVAICVAMGVSGGLLAITRENALVWLPLVGIWMAWRIIEQDGGRMAGACGGDRSDSAKVGQSKDPPQSPLSKGGGKETNFCGNGIRCCGALAAYVLGVAVVLVPVGARNVLVGGSWSLSTFQSGPNFYIGNHSGADGRYQPLVRGHETPAFERADATMLAERAVGRTLTAREVSDYWWSRAAADIRADVSGWLELLGRKWLMVWNRYEVSDAESFYVYADASRVVGGLSTVWDFGVLCPLAAMGLLLTAGQWRRLWILYALIASMAVSVAVFYVMARYRFPLVPLLIPFAAVGLVELWGIIVRWLPGHARTGQGTPPARSRSGLGKKSGRGTEWRGVELDGDPLVAVGPHGAPNESSEVPTLERDDDGGIGSPTAEAMGQPDKMHAAEVTPLDPPLARGEGDATPTRPPPRRGRGFCSDNAARLDCGDQVLDCGNQVLDCGAGAVGGVTMVGVLVVGMLVAGVVHWPIHPESRLNAMAWMNVGVAMAEGGDVAGATVYFRRAVEGHPKSAEANNNLGMALAVQGDFAGAVDCYERALASEPGLMGVDYNLAVALERVGRLDEARMHYEQALALNPSDADARAALERLRSRG
jgi:hypothetical protein